MSRACPFATEAEMVAAWVAQLRSRRNGASDWTVYAETAGWDLLLVHRDGYQLGLEAKLSLNAKVIDQTLKGCHKWYDGDGPDYRGALVPKDCIQHHLASICRAIGIGIVEVRPPERGVTYGLGLPDEGLWGGGWPSWLPAERCKLPDYVPDVEAGKKSPVALTHWKVKAIRLMILLERRGFVTRSDMKALQIGPTRWTDRFNGFLAADPARGGYVRCKYTPDLRAQHPVNYAEIEADFEKWCPPGYLIEAEQAA